MLRGEVTHTNFIIFGLTQPGLKPTIYRTRGEHANHYTTDAVTEIGTISKHLILCRKFCIDNGNISHNLVQLKW